MLMQLRINNSQHLIKSIDYSLQAIFIQKNFNRIFAHICKIEISLRGGNRMYIIEIALALLTATKHHLL
jgi:hypothetical protein